MSCSYLTLQNLRSFGSFFSESIKNFSNFSYVVLKKSNNIFKFVSISLASVFLLLVMGIFSGILDWVDEQNYSISYFFSGSRLKHCWRKQMLQFLRKPQLFFVICFYRDTVRFDNITVSIFILFSLKWVTITGFWSC